MRRSTVCVALIVASFLGAAELKIAVIDIQETMVGYKLHGEVQAELKKKEEERKKQLNESEEKLKRAETALEQFEPGTPEYNQHNLIVCEMDALIKAMKRRFAMELTELRDKRIEEMQKNINDEIQRYAAQKNIDLILRRYFLDLKAGAQQPLVIYAAPALDITADIVQRLNSKAGK
jgi:Skp family chaperone for outer membrane proteins